MEQNTKQNQKELLWKVNQILRYMDDSQIKYVNAASFEQEMRNQLTGYRGTDAKVTVTDLEGKMGTDVSMSGYMEKTRGNGITIDEEFIKLSKNLDGAGKEKLLCHVAIGNVRRGNADAGMSSDKSPLLEWRKMKGELKVMLFTPAVPAPVHYFWNPKNYTEFQCNEKCKLIISHLEKENVYDFIDNLYDTLTQSKQKSVDAKKFSQLNISTKTADMTQDGNTQDAGKEM